MTTANKPPGATISPYDRYTMEGDYTEKQKEWFSRAFLAAVSAVAGYRISWDLDDLDGVDATVRDGGITVDFQMKATGVPNLRRDTLAFDLDVPTYRKLSEPRTSPGYLLVVVIPADLPAWINQSSHELTLHHCGYWLDLSGAGETSNKTKIRLDIPLQNQLNVPALMNIMAEARERVLAQ